MAEILLTHSYFLRFDPKENRVMMPYPPLGTLYAASYLRHLGFSVGLHDVMLARDEGSILEAIERERPAIVVIYDDQFNYLTKMCLGRMRVAAFRVSELAKQRGCMVIVFSSDATDHLEKYFAHGADAVICGEAELTLGELASALLRKRSDSLRSISGIAFRHEGSIVRTARRPVLEDLDALPFPAWDLIDIDRYRRAWKGRHGYFSLNMVTTRGCPFHCNWCAKPIYGQVYHSRSPENVVEEMSYLKHTIHPDHIWFADDIFGLKPGWIGRFADAVHRAGAAVPFKCLSRADLLLQEEAIRHLYRAGCRTVWIGAESGSQRILDAMEKGITVDQIFQASSLLHKQGIRVGFFLQFGYPGETKEDIEKTFQMVRECMPDELGISVSYPLPGTKFFDRVRQQLGEKQNWEDSQDLDMMFQGTYVPDFYRALHRVTHKKFSIWRGIQAARNAVRSPRSLHGGLLRPLAAMIYHGATLPFEMRRLRALEQTRV